MSKIRKKILKDQLFASLKLEVINHLNGISNQNVSVPVPNHESVSVVKDLINEVVEETEIGIVYMGEYIKTLSMIAGLKREK